MKNILVPTDFSENAETAMNFAILLARQQNAQITLLHVFELSLELGTLPLDILNSERAEQTRIHEDRLDSLARKISYTGNINNVRFVREGPVVETVVNFAKQNQVDMIVMGTRGESGVGEFMFGSITGEVIEKSGCPVLAIPQGIAVEEPVRRITYATNFLKSDLAALKMLTTIAEPMGASITILHIVDESTSHEEEVKKLGHFINKVSSVIDYDRFSFELINGTDVETEIQEYISEGKTDLLVLSTEYRNFFGRLLDISTTKEIVQSANVPVIAFHHHKHTPVNIY